MLKLAKLSYRYHRSEAMALDSVTLDIASGQVFGLLGPNGAGKTTLISLIAGLLPLQSGSINVNGESFHALRRRLPRVVSLVPQDYAFYPMLSVRENIDFFAGVHGLVGEAQGQAVMRALAFARLEGVAGKLAGQLSGGLKRRLNLAIGVLGDPQLLLLDEPTAGVDPQSRRFLLDSIAELGAMGKTVIYTSHYMDEVEAICQSLAIMDYGRVLTSGSLTELLAGAGRELQLRLDRALPARLHDAWRQNYRLTEWPGYTYKLELALRELPGLLEELQATSCELLSLSYGQRNLEQLFMQLTQRSLRD